MFKGIKVVLLLILAAGWAAAEPVKIASWNLQWFPGGDPKAKSSEKRKHMKAAQEALKVLNPDVLCLQEVKDWKAVAELASVLPNLRPVVVSRFDGDQQQAILSQLPADSAWSDAWDSSEVSDLPRGYAFAALRMPDNSFLLVYSIHMKANGRGGDAANISKREESSRQLLAHAEEMRKIYGQRGKVGIILAGDWNTTLDPDSRFDAEKTIRGPLAAGFKWAWDKVPFEERITHPGDDKWPSITLDHILTAGVKAGPGYLVNLPKVSDHMPTLVNVESVTGDAEIVLAPKAEPEPEAAAAEPTRGGIAPSGPDFSVEEGAPAFQIREIIITPPTFNPGIPGVRQTPVPEPTP